MANISIKEFLNTLVKIVFSSPSSILYIIVGIIFLIAMVVNIRKKKTIGKTLYLIAWIFIITFLITRYNNYLTTLLDNLINNVFMQVFFPNLATYVIIIILSNIIYIKSILKKNQKTYEKIINTIFFGLIMFNVCYTLEEIVNNKLNIYDLDIYSNQKILVLVETVTIVFVVWQITLVSKNLITKLINLSNKKIENELTEESDGKAQEDNFKIQQNNEMTSDNTQNVNNNVVINSQNLNDETIKNQDIKTNNVISQSEHKVDSTPNGQAIIELSTTSKVNSQTPIGLNTGRSVFQDDSKLNNDSNNTIPSPDIFNQVPIPDNRITEYKN